MKKISTFRIMWVVSIINMIINWYFVVKSWKSDIYIIPFTSYMIIRFNGIIIRKIIIKISSLKIFS